MSSNCKHPTCYDSELCRREQKPKKVYALKRTPLKRSTKPINKVSPKNKKAEVNGDSWSNLRDDLDAVFSLWVRISNADINGYCRCFCCHKKIRYQDADNAHFIPRSNLSTRFNKINCRVNCKHCNQYLDGNLKLFASRLEEERIGTVQMLTELSREVVSLSVSDLKELLSEYKYKLKIAKMKFTQK